MSKAYNNKKRKVVENNKYSIGQEVVKNGLTYQITAIDVYSEDEIYLALELPNANCQFLIVESKELE